LLRRRRFSFHPRKPETPAIPGKTAMAVRKRWSIALTVKTARWDKRMTIACQQAMKDSCLER
jgi:hypothetical protein